MKHFGRSMLNPTLAVLSALAAGAAVAEPATKVMPSSFQDYDSNGDGKVSLEEFKAQGGIEQAFTDVDTNQDKSLSKDEFSKLGKPSTQRY